MFLRRYIGTNRNSLRLVGTPTFTKEYKSTKVSVTRGGSAKNERENLGFLAVGLSVFYMKRASFSGQPR